ncbi:Rrf2 family transcriptional regulator [Brucepastera parasyntrophica]|uniref:Rrf2 family transcriptional regulator n=1 Tax=Brucepastera parasyntrophica TaxID=2880008 RepID=UPI00210E1CFF|nr:Rrf2 family transcriptional regulator [Brucepastera parasyntrophica]ULQ60970.1 Rrf2 family transcriptional regulator [Brucepastera parasyntrophica]
MSTQFTNAVHALIMIAYLPDIRVTSEMVAESVGNNPVIIRNIYGKLKQAGILSVQRGTGVTELAKPANKITLWEVYQAVETDAAGEIFKFSDTLSEICPVGSSIRELLLIHLQNAVTALKDSLSKTTIEELRYEIEAYNEQKIDFPSIVAWYKENGFDKGDSLTGYTSKSAEEIHGTEPDEDKNLNEKQNSIRPGLIKEVFAVYRVPQ